jgi:hypothetical protein
MKNGNQTIESRGEFGECGKQGKDALRRKKSLFDDI